MRSKSAVMARCELNLQTSIEITSLALKMERKDKNRCLGGLRMEDQGAQSPPTFLVKSFSFLQLPHKRDDRGCLKIQTWKTHWPTDRRPQKHRP